MRQYLTFSVVLSLLLLLPALLDYPQKSSLVHDHFLYLVIFFFLQSMPVSWLLQQSENTDSGGPIYIIASIGFRMITGLLALVVFYYFNMETFTLLAIDFVALYLVYLIFELTLVLANLRRNSGHNSLS